MTAIDHQLPHEAAVGGTDSSVYATVWSGLGLWFRTCADYYDAAATYGELARLSNAELERRGLSRDTLGRDVCVANGRRE